MKIALKVDCDTAEGTKNGIPRLLDALDHAGVRGSFFFSLGPDRSGRAIFRVFTRPGFLSKMRRSRAASLYGVRTMLYGTLLPSPVISRVAAPEMRSVAEAGHEAGVHAWDHVSWHDRLDRWSEEKIAAELSAAHEAFAGIFGRPAAASACAGWTVSDRYLAVRERLPLLYTSDTRGGEPFFPRLGGAASAILEIPSTLPTLDEMLGDPRFPSPEALLRFYATIPPSRGTIVHTIHTEVEGGPYLGWFRELLVAWRARGAQFVTLEEAARQLLLRREEIPSARIVRTAIPGRAGTVAAPAS